MSWDEPPGPRRDQRLVSGVVVLLLVAGFVVLAGSRDRDATLPITGSEDLRVEDLEFSLGPTEIGSVETSRNVSGAGPLLPSATDLTIIAADFVSRLQVVDGASGDVDTLQVFADGTRGRPSAMQIVGNRVVVNTTNGTVVVFDEGLTRPVVVARRQRMVVTTGTGSVWVHNGDGTGPTATRLSFDGDVLEQAELPALAQPLAGTEDGLLVGTPGTVSWIDGDGSRRMVARGQALASDGARLARVECAGDLSCAVWSGTIDDPDQVRIPLRSGDLPVGVFDRPRGLFSPDGRWLALPLYRRDRNGRITDSRLMVIDLALGVVAVRMHGSRLTRPDTPFGWSRDSRWLVVSDGSRLQAWSTRTFDVADLDIRLSPTYALVVR